MVKIYLTSASQLKARTTKSSAIVAAFISIQRSTRKKDLTK